MTFAWILVILYEVKKRVSMSFKRLDQIDMLWEDLRSIIVLSEIAEDLNDESPDDTIIDVRAKRTFAINDTLKKIHEVYDIEELDEHSN